jgi:hypothetical protein
MMHREEAKMDTGLIPKVLTIPVLNGGAAAQPVQVRGSVATELPSPQSVTATANTDPTTNNPTPPSAATAANPQISIDPTTLDVVFRVIESGQIVSQDPTEAALHIAAYTAPVRHSAEDSPSSVKGSGQGDINRKA